VTAKNNTTHQIADATARMARRTGRREHWAEDHPAKRPGGRCRRGTPRQATIARQSRRGWRVLRQPNAGPGSTHVNPEPPARERQRGFARGTADLQQSIPDTQPHHLDERVEQIGRVFRTSFLIALGDRVKRAPQPR
jgi:hypothetical protein